MVKKIIHTVDQLIAAFERSGAPLPEWAGIGATAVANWAARGFIPPGWHLRLYAEAYRRGLHLDLEALFGLPPDECEVLCVLARRERAERPVSRTAQQ
jgi:hypothetical protein